VHIQVSFTLDGWPARVAVKPHHNLLDALRQQLGVTSCKKGCATADCGACLVYLDGELANACLVRAATVQGREVRTVESLGGPGHLSVLQQAFVNYGAVRHAAGPLRPGTWRLPATEHPHQR
jgi:aerobic-type carbon monoxide dehydrogenase small subunit (CoxS/CutS family)